MSVREKKPNKRSIIGSMGLPDYEPSPEAGTQPDTFASEDDVKKDRRQTSHLVVPNGYADENGRSPLDRRSSSVAPSTTASEKTKRGSLFGTLKGKKSAPTGPPPDTRRKKYNEAFGKRDSFYDRANGKSDREQPSSPQNDRARTAEALRSGNIGAAGLVGVSPAEQIKEDAQAHLKEDSDEEGVNGAAGATGLSTPAADSEVDEAPVQAEPSDVRDEESPHHIATSTSLAPGLTGGYLDEKIPSYELDDPTSQGEPLAKGAKDAGDEKKDNKSNGGVIAAATGGVAAALTGTAAYLSGKNDEEKTEDQEEDKGAVGSAKKEDTAVPDNDSKSVVDAEEKDNTAALVADEQRQQAKKTKSSVRKGGVPVKAKRTQSVKPLTPHQRHYLLKALVSLQMQNEWSELEKLGALTQYGYPFTLDRPRLKRVKDKNLQLDGDFARGDFEELADDPYGDVDEDEIRKQEGLMEPLILRHMFHAHLHTFPGLDQAPLKYWQKRIQPFFDEMAARNFSTSIERSETTSRHFYTLALTRYLGGFFSRGVGVRGEGELRGSGKGLPGTDRWGKGKEWGKGTVKRGLDKPVRPDEDLMNRIDNLFDGREGEVWRRARKETTRVKRDWQAFKEFTIERESGLEEAIAYLDVGNLRNLPPHYRNAEEYARHHAAYIFHSLFVNSPNADNFFNILRGIHLLFPYWGAKQLLKVANAQTMIQGILSLLLARPAGAKSLVQRIFVSVIGGQASTIHKDFVQPLAKAIKDEELCRRLEAYVKRGNRPEGKALRNRALRTDQDILATILLYAGGKQLGHSKKKEVQDLHDAFAESPFRGNVDAAYPDNTPPAKEGKIQKISSWGKSRDEENDALKYAMLKLYLRELLRRRDRDQACQMASGSLVPSIIKESLDTVFYGPIKKIAEHADLSARLGDLQAFLDDIIRTRKAGPNTLPDWIALTARHENSLYFLFHECAPILKPFVEWIQGGADFMALSTTDPAHPANRKAKNIEVNLENLLQSDSLTDEDVDGILQETDELIEYVKWQKVWYELEMRKNFLLGTGAAIPQSGLCADDLPKNSNMRKEIEDVDGLLSQLMEQDGVRVEDGTVSNKARGTEIRDFPWAWFDAADPLHQHLDVHGNLSYEPRSTSAKVPSLVHLRKALDPFQQALLEKLPAWKEGNANGVPATPKNIRPRDKPDTVRRDDTKSLAGESHQSEPKKSLKSSQSRFKLPFLNKS